MLSFRLNAMAMAVVLGFACAGLTTGCGEVTDNTKPPPSQTDEPYNIIVANTDFEDSTTDGWAFLGKDWRVLSKDGGKVLEGRGPSSALKLVPLSQPRVEMRVTLIVGSVTLGYRANLGLLTEDIGGGHSHGDTGHSHAGGGHATLPIGALNQKLHGYALDVRASRMVLRSRSNWNNNGITLADTNVEIGLDTPHLIGIDSVDEHVEGELVGRTIRVWLDNNLTIEVSHATTPCEITDSCGPEDNPSCVVNEQRCVGKRVQACMTSGIWDGVKDCPDGKTCMIMSDGYQHCMEKDPSMGELMVETRYGIYVEPGATSIVHVDDIRVMVHGQEEWTLEQTGIMHGGGATAMQFSSTEPDTVYLITGYNALGAWRSTDGGDTWTRFYQGLHLLSIGLDPEFTDHILIGDNLGQIMRSTNRGLSWDVVAAAPLSVGQFNEGDAANIWGFAFDPADPTTVYAASSDRRFLVSTDRGSNWESFDVKYPNATSLAVDQGGSGMLYVGTTYGVWRSDDQGEHWGPTKITPGITMSVACHPEQTGVLLAGTTHGLYASDDFGDSWVERTEGLTDTDITIIEWSKADPNTVLVGTYSGIFVSRDGGVTWTQQSEGLTNPDTGALAASPNDPNHFVSATADWWFNRKPGDHAHEQGLMHAMPGTFVSRNGGDLWASLGNTYQDRDAYALAVDPANPSTLYIGTMCSRGMFKTEDLGATFAHLPAQASHYTMRIEVAPWDSDTIYMTSATGLHRSEDGGTMWSDLLTGGHFHGLAVGADQTIYGGTAPSEGGAAGRANTGESAEEESEWDMNGAHIFRSMDGGESWDEISEGFPWESTSSSAINTIVISPSTPEVVYLATDAAHGMDQLFTPLGLYRSDNRGDLWVQRNSGLPSKAIADLAIDATNADRVFAATREGLAVTMTGGVTWTALTTERTNAVVLGANGLVIAGTPGMVMVSTDDGATWSTVLAGIDGKNVWELVIDDATNTLLAGVEDRGLRRFDLSTILQTP